VNGLGAVTFAARATRLYLRKMPGGTKLRPNTSWPHWDMLHVLVGGNADDFDTVVDAGRNGESVIGWVVPKKAVVSDHVLLFTRSRGFVADALVASPQVPGEFGQKHIFRADVGPVRLFSSPIPLAFITRVIPEWPWATYPRSYTTPPPPIAEALLAAIRGFQVDLGSSEADSTETFTEGMVHRQVVSRYERNPNLRAACIRHHGPACAVCGFSYGETYGPEFDGLIVVHHLTPISTDGDSHDVDPIADLRPVCADCHLVIHRRPTPFTIEEVREMMAHASAEPGEVGG